MLLYGDITYAMRLIDVMLPLCMTWVIVVVWVLMKQLCFVFVSLVFTLAGQCQNHQGGTQVLLEPAWRHR